MVSAGSSQVVRDAPETCPQMVCTTRGHPTRDPVPVVDAAVPLTGVALDVSTARTSMSQLAPSREVVSVAVVAVAGELSVQPPPDGHDAVPSLCRV